jgi:predicted peptidase
MSLGHSDFVLVSSFGFRVSDLIQTDQVHGNLAKGAAVKAIARVLALAVLTATTGLPARAGEKVQTGFVPRVFKDTEGESKYVVFVPHSYTPDKQYPLILFLHGAGERGDDGDRPVKQGIGNAITFKNGEKSFQFFVIFPQCRKGANWQATGLDARRALAMLNEVQKEYKIDNNRVYLTGLSMGGFGTWSLAAADPTRWAAIVPICGAGDPSQASKIKDIPCWAFVGSKDSPKLVEGTRNMVEAMKKAGGEPRFTEFPYVGHNSWDPAYATPELYPWLLKQVRK